MKKNLKENIKQFIPNIRFLTQLLARKGIKALYRTALSAQEIRLAEADFTVKEQTVLQCRTRWAALSEKTEKSALKFINSSPEYNQYGLDEQKHLIIDILFCRFAYGFLLDEYIAYHLDQKSAEERKEFISEREHLLFYYKMNDIIDASVFKDKMRTYELYQNYYCRDVIAVSSPKDYHTFCSFISRHPVFVKKNAYEACGRSIEKINFAECGKTERELFDMLLSEGKAILEECVIQHPITAVFNASSVNTVRVITFNTKHGILTPYCFLKIGRAGSFVDNAGAGGIFAAIDENTGVVNSRGIDELHREYDVHPDSGVPFMGYQLPDWEGAIAMCKEMAAIMPKVKYIGWDLAYTEEGKWIVIEGNGMSQFICPQTIWQRGIKSEVMRIMDDIDLMT